MFLLVSTVSGCAIFAKFSMNFLYKFASPMNERMSLIFLGLGKFCTAVIFFRVWGDLFVGIYMTQNRVKLVKPKKHLLGLSFRPASLSLSSTVDSLVKCVSKSLDFIIISPK